MYLQPTHVLSNKSDASLFSGLNPCLPLRELKSKEPKLSSKNLWYFWYCYDRSYLTRYLYQSLPFQKVQHKVTTLDAQPSSTAVPSLLVSVTGLLLVSYIRPDLIRSFSFYHPISGRWLGESTKFQSSLSIATVWGWPVILCVHLLIFFIITIGC